MSKPNFKYKVGDLVWVVPVYAKQGWDPSPCIVVKRSVVFDPGLRRYDLVFTDGDRWTCIAEKTLNDSRQACLKKTKVKFR